MKNTVKNIWLAASFFVVFAACDDSDFLDTLPYSTNSPDNHYQTLNDFETALVGCYDAINMLGISGDDMSDGTYMVGLQYMLSAGNDELILNTNAIGSDINSFGNASYSASNTAIGDFWKAYYAGIMRCNYLLDKAASKSFEDETEQNGLIEMTAEARFLRSFFYYHLAVLFGGVPLNTSSVADAEAHRESLESIYTNLIIPDLQFAWEHLPPTPVMPGRAGKYTAGGYLGVIYNYLAAAKRYQAGESLAFPLNSFQWVDADHMSAEAVDILREVVDNSPCRLISRYDYLFRETTKTHQQEECLFTAEYALAAGGDSYPNVSEIFCPGGNASVYGGSYTTHRPVVEFYESYDEDRDSRLKHNITGVYNAQSATEVIEGVTYYVPAASQGATFWNNGTGKYRHMDPREKLIRVTGSAISIPLLRYADVLLQYAEALYFTNDEPLARTYFTSVRERIVTGGYEVSELDEAYYKDDFVEELLDERKRELCYESKRRIDLFRFGKLTEIIHSLDPDAGLPNQRVTELQANWDEYKMWFPIPQREIGLNPGLIQNPGY